MKTDQIENLVHNLEIHIEKAKPGILNLHDNWDEKGARGYNAEFWNHAMKFLRRFLKQVWSSLLKMPLPNILPGPEGSIDLNWDDDPINLLINIPQDPNEPVSFYGEYSNKKEIEGSIELELIDSVLIPWLMSRQ
jgi:hypothetical protein